MPRLYQSFLGGKIDADLTDSGTSLSSPALASMDVVASPDTMMVVLDPEGIDGAPETVEITAHTASATTATMVRGADGTMARAHNEPIRWVHSVVETDLGYGGMVELETVELASADTFSFSSIPATYRDLVIIGELRSDTAATNDGTFFQVGNGTVDTGANYRNMRAIIDEAGTSSTLVNEADTELQASGVADTADTGMFATFEVTIFKYADSSRRRHVMGMVAMADVTTGESQILSGVWENTADAIDIVTLFPNAGTDFVTGSYLTLYGRGRA